MKHLALIPFLMLVAETLPVAVPPETKEPPLAAMADRELPGVYRIRGKEPSGTYGGIAVIWKEAEKSGGYRILWITRGEPRQEGVGMVHKRTLSFAWTTIAKKLQGVTVYDIHDSGALTGTWIVDGGEKATETLHRIHGLKDEDDE